MSSCTTYSTFFGIPIGLSEVRECSIGFEWIGHSTGMVVIGYSTAFYIGFSITFVVRGRSWTTVGLDTRDRSLTVDMDFSLRFGSLICTLGSC